MYLDFLIVFIEATIFPLEDSARGGGDRGVERGQLGQNDVLTGLRQPYRADGKRGVSASDEPIAIDLQRKLMGLLGFRPNWQLVNELLKRAGVCQSVFVAFDKNSHDPVLHEGQPIYATNRLDLSSKAGPLRCGIDYYAAPIKWYPETQMFRPSRGPSRRPPSSPNSNTE